jgi:hypothetical protein
MDFFNNQNLVSVLVPVMDFFNNQNLVSVLVPVMDFFNNQNLVSVLVISRKVRFWFRLNFRFQNGGCFRFQLINLGYLAMCSFGSGS